MGGPAIRGHQGQFKLFVDGALSDVIDITKVSIKEDGSFSRNYYVGRPVGESDRTVEGFSGSIDLDVKDASVDKFIDALINDNLNGIGVSDYSFITTEQYPDGTSQSYAYFDCVFMMSREAGGLTEKITKRLEFQAAARKAL